MSAAVSGTTPTVLVVLHADSTDIALVQEVLVARGMQVRVLRAHAGERGPDSSGVRELAGLIVLGGAMGAYQADRYLFLNESMRLLDAAVECAVPTIAICLGSQLLATVAGGTAYPGEAGLEWGFVPIKITGAGRADPVLGDPLLAVAASTSPSTQTASTCRPAWTCWPSRRATRRRSGSARRWACSSTPSCPCAAWTG